MAERFSYIFVTSYFEDNNCTLLETEYKNNITPMKYKCSCGNISTVRFNDFKSGTRCKQCGWNKTSKSNKTKHSQEFVEKFFEDNGCKLFDIYKNSDTPVKYRCNCGNMAKIRFPAFKRGDRCKSCGYKKISGENSVVWVKDRNKISTIQELHARAMPHKYQYKKKYNIDKSLHVDHIIPIKAFRDHGIYDPEIINHESNFQVLTKSENSKKNSKYTEEQFLEYIKNFNKEI